MTSRIITAICLSVVVALSSANAQDTIFFPAADRIAVRHLPSIPSIELVPGVRVHTIVGATGSVSLGEFDSAGVAPLHHHTREQADVGLSGRSDMTIGTNVEFLEPGYGVIVPANVRHSIANPRGGVRTVLEFHTVRRPDLVPPRPVITFPLAAEPVAFPADRRLVRPMDAPNGSTLTGETCTMRWRHVTGAVDVHPVATATELFVYVARGTVRVAAPGLSSTLSTGMLMMVPATTRNVQLSSAGAEDASVIEFSVRSP
jgi:mannose-6-phosphate isomerase-like protein (cupin superfamily)